MPRSAAPADPPPPMHGPLVIAHRGASGYRPEHTASAYRLAFAQGVDAVEPDLVVSRDGVLLIRHENEISGTTDIAARAEFADRRTTKMVDGRRISGWFAEDLEWGELTSLRCRERLPELRRDSAAWDGAEPILRLNDLLALIDAEPRPITLVIELKHVHFLAAQGHDLVELLLRDLRACGWDERPEQVVIECFELAPLLRLREAGLPASYVFLLESVGTPADDFAGHDYPWYRSEAGVAQLAGQVDGISIAKRDLLADPGIVERAARHGLGVYTWTLRPENAYLAREHRIGRDPAAWGNWRAEWSQVIQTGVDGVFVDHPDLWFSLARRPD